MSEKHKDGGPAFGSGNPTHGGYSGMSLRDWFAGQALAGIAAIESHDMRATAPYSAREAYLLADAMLAEREKAND